MQKNDMAVESNRFFIHAVSCKIFSKYQYQ